MKIKKLTTAVALATIATSGAAIAGDHGNAITSALANGKLSGEVYGGYQSASLDDGTDADASDFNLHAARLGYSANIGDGKSFGIQIGLNPNAQNNLETDDSGNLIGNQDSEITVRDLYFAKDYGDWTFTGGRFLSVADPETAIRQRDALFNQVVSPLDALFNQVVSPLDGVSISNPTLALLDTEVTRRIDGVEATFTNETGLHASLAVYKGGIDTTDDETERNFGYSGSIGINLGDSDLAFGVTLSAFQEDGDSNDITGVDLSEEETSGYKLSSFIATGPIVATLSYADQEFESKDTGGVQQEDVEVDTISFSGAWNISGAQRSFNEFGVLQGPSVAAGAKAYELVVSYDTTGIEIGAGDDDVDGFGIGLNAYCGQFMKYNLSYQSAEVDDANVELDSIQLGARLSF